MFPKRSRFTQQPIDVTHSNAIARVADGDAPSFGSGSKETFDQRKEVEKNRQYVEGFHSAGVVHNYRDSARQHEATKRRMKAIRERIQQKTQSRDSTSLQRFNATSAPRPVHKLDSAAPRRRFTEPTSRRYNPFG